MRRFSKECLEEKLEELKRDVAGIINSAVFVTKELIEKELKY